MTETEGRSLVRTSAVLLLAALIRYGVAARAGPPLMPADSAASLTALIARSESERDDAARRSAPLAAGERLDPNVADEIELDRLPGVGPATARAVVAARDAGVAFARPEDLLQVAGIGPATLQRMLPHLDFSVPTPSARADPGGSRLDLNRASREALLLLPGIGPALAERILAERERRGGFSSVDELTAVSGIGPATLERVRPLVEVR